MKFSTIQDLTPGQTVSIYHRQWGVTNRATFLRPGSPQSYPPGIGYFKPIHNAAAAEFAIWNHEIETGLYVITSGKQPASAGEKAWQTFKAEFIALCQRYGGEFNAKESIGAGVAYHIPTAWGILRVSIHDSPYLHNRRARTQRESIYLQFRDYTGPAPFPLRGDCGTFSNKWNIHISGGTLAAVRAAALIELQWRLENVPAPLPLLPPVQKPSLPIAALYGEMLAAVNRGDLARAQTYAQQIAA